MWLAALVAGPHLVQDGGHLIEGFMTHVKRADPRDHPGLTIAVDQTFHVLALF